MNSIAFRPPFFRRLIIAFGFDFKRVVIMLVVAAAYCFVWWRFGLSEVRAAVWDFFDTALKLGTLAFALTIWAREKYQSWEDRLPKQLFVEFCLTGNPILRAERVPLLSEGDLRPFSQQVGAQMVGGRNLKFSLNITHWTHVANARRPKEAYKCYVTRFELDPVMPVVPPPKPVCRYPEASPLPESKSLIDLIKLSDEGKCLYLCPPLSDQPVELMVSALQPLPGTDEV